MSDSSPEAPDDDDDPPLGLPRMRAGMLTAYSRFLPGKRISGHWHAARKPSSKHATPGACEWQDHPSCKPYSVRPNLGHEAKP